MTLTSNSDIEYTQDKFSHLWTIRVDGLLIAQISVLADLLLIEDIYVRAEYRRRGLATRLYKHAKSQIDVKHDYDHLSPDGKQWVASLHEQ